MYSNNQIIVYFIIVLPNKFTLTLSNEHGVLHLEDYLKVDKEFQISIRKDFEILA